ncbi:hypothetical protein ABKN59_005210 [Abortiporus biennis]
MFKRTRTPHHGSTRIQTRHTTNDPNSLPTFDVASMESHGVQALQTARRSEAYSMDVKRLPQLPNELWLSILANGVLSSQDVQSLSLTCQQFRYMSQPLLFSKFVISWNAQVGEGRLRERLAVFTSDRFNWAVNTVAILHPGRLGGVQIMDMDYLSRFATPIFLCLRQFPNLKELAVDTIPIDEFFFNIIESLTSLARLHLQSPIIGPDTVAPEFYSRLRISSLTIYDDDWDPESNGRNVTRNFQHLESVFSIRSLRELRLTGFQINLESIISNPSQPELPYIQLLELDYRSLFVTPSSTPAKLFKFFARFSGVEILEVSNIADFEEHVPFEGVPNTIFPKLKSVKGAPNLVIFFCYGRDHIRAVEVDGGIRGFKHAADFVILLSRFCANLEAFTLSINIAPPVEDEYNLGRLLFHILHSFPRLRYCHLGYFSCQTLPMMSRDIRLAELSIHPNLEILLITPHKLADNEVEKFTDVSNIYPLLIDRMGQLLPSLKRFVMCGNPRSHCVITWPNKRNLPVTAETYPLPWYQSYTNAIEFL